MCCRSKGEGSNGLGESTLRARNTVVAWPTTCIYPLCIWWTSIISPFQIMKSIVRIGTKNWYDGAGSTSIEPFPSREDNPGRCLCIENIKTICWKCSHVVKIQQKRASYWKWTRWRTFMLLAASSETSRVDWAQKITSGKLYLEH